MQVLIFIALFVLVCWLLGVMSQTRHQRQVQAPTSESLKPTDMVQPLLTLEAHVSGVSCLTMSPDRSLLASGGADGEIKLWDLRTGQLIGSFREHQGAIAVLAISPDQQLLISGSQDGTIKIWQLQELGRSQHHSPLPRR